ncbi:MAG TPA: hypothetical protein VF234_08680 [Limnochordia bacterium]
MPVLMAALVVLWTENARAADCGPWSLEEIVQRVTDVHRISDEPMTFRQDVDLRVTLFRWSFSTTVRKQGQTMQVSIEHGPWFLPEEVTSTLAAPATILSEFDLRADGTEVIDGVLHCLIAGERKPGVSGGAESGRVWIRPGLWLITRVDADYWWGSLRVDLAYGKVQGRTVLTEQRALLRPMGVEVRIRNTDYSFGDAATESS